MEVQQQLKVHWIGEDSGGQDVSIRLVTLDPDNHRQEAVAVVKIHSHVLSTHSKYFKACLSERWAQANSSSPVVDLTLELQADKKYYFDCFSHMVSPLLEYFKIPTAMKRIEYFLALLQVASQIEFHKLMDSISRYLACITWSPEDEIRIREYSTSPGFSRGHAEDLVERLGLDESEEDRHKQLWDVIQQLIRTALEPNRMLRSEPSRAFLKVALQDGIGSSSSSSFARMVATLVTREAKDMLHNLVEEYKGNDRSEILGFHDKLTPLCWVLEELLQTEVAEDVLRSFVHADAIQAKVLSSRQGREVQELVLHMYEAVVRGRLLLNTKERLALLVIWNPVLKLSMSNTAYDQATTRLFQTLPLEKQMELIQQHPKTFNVYISSSDLLSTLSKGRNWQAIKLQDVDASSLANDEAGAEKQVAE